MKKSKPSNGKRPAKEKSFSIRLSKEMRAQLKYMADTENRSVSNMIKTLVSEGMAARGTD